MQQNRNIRWAILGAGKIAHKFASDFKAVKNAELVVVAARDVDRAKEFAGQYGIPSACSYEELYNNADIEAVYIATTHNFHFEQALACLQSGKAVLCEKPVTINDREFKILAQLSKEKQVFLMEAMWTYFLPAMQKAKQWIDEGRIGTIKAIHADFGYQMDYDPAGRLYNSQLAGGALLDLGIYPIAFSLFFTNRVPVNIHASSLIGPTGVDESTAVILDFEGLHAVLHCSILTHTLTTGTIYGEKGYIQVPGFFKATSASLYDNQKNLLDAFTDGRDTSGYNYETQEVTDCLLNNQVESSIMPQKLSNNLQEIMTTIRRQVGLRYPMEGD